MLNPKVMKSLGRKLNDLKSDSSAEVFYDLMSGGLVWSDEQVTNLTREEMGCQRALFSFRSGLITNEVRERFQTIWDQARAEFPEWIGFQDSRCQPNEELGRLIHKSKKSSERYVRRLP
jgi:hypothetical protein